MTLAAFAAECRRLQHGARSAPAAIDRYLLSAARRPPLLLSIYGTDRRTDARTSDRYRAPRRMQAAYIMISVEFVDIDECADPTICAVGITILPCVNTYGNYTCLELTPSLRKCSTFVHLSMRI